MDRTASQTWPENAATALRSMNRVPGTAARAHSSARGRSREYVFAWCTGRSTCTSTGGAGGRPGTSTPPRPAGLSTLTPNSFLLAGLGLPHLERLDDLAAADKIGSAYVPFQPILPGHD